MFVTIFGKLGNQRQKMPPATLICTMQPPLPAASIGSRITSENTAYTCRLMSQARVLPSQAPRKNPQRVAAVSDFLTVGFPLF